MNQLASTPIVASSQIVPPIAPVKAASVLVPLDGTEPSLAALPVARAIAELEQVTLHVVHIGERVLPPQELLEKLGLDVERVHGTVLDQDSGDPVEGIVRAARRQQSPYLVMCTHTGERDPAAELGSVAREVLMRAPCPVVMVPPSRGQRSWHPRLVLLPYDGTPGTTAAAGPALDFTERAGAELSVLHVTAPGAGPPREPGSITAPRYVDQAQHEWPAWAGEFLERACSTPDLTGRLRLALAIGETGVEIVSHARQEHANLVVLGWHGHWEGEHATAAKTILRQSPCPVLMLRVT